MPKIKPIKYLGQNFLIDKNVIKKVIKVADLKSKDIVLEIGPGMGALTREIAKKAKRVIAVEKDPRMCQLLKERLKNSKNIEVINKDILKLALSLAYHNCVKLSLTQISQERYKVIANLPFYITAPVIRKFLEAKNPPQEMVLIIQKEVAQRICAKPCPHPYAKRCRRAPKMTILAVSVQFYAQAKIISYVSRKSFQPQPKVDAAIIRIKPKNKKQRTKNKEINSDNFFKIVKAGFSHPRKQLVNNLTKELKLNKQKLSSLLLKLGIKPTQRAETLSIQDWINLTNK